MTTAEKNSLSPDAELAWKAYEAMGLTKHVYFSFLTELNQKYDKNESPGIAENLKLEQLLAAHDRGVKAFKAAMSNIEEPTARQLLLDKLSSASATTGTD